MNDTIKKRVTAPLFIILILLLVSLATLIPVINMLILGAMIAYGIRPIAKKIQSKAKFNSISIILAMILVVIPLILLVVYLFYVFVGFAISFVNLNGSALSNFDLNQLIQLAISNLPQSSQNYLNSNLISLTNSISSGVSSLINWVLNYVIDLLKDIPSLSLQLFVLLFSIFYFTRDGDSVMEYIKTFIPNEQESLFNKIIFEVQNVLKSIFYGHFLTAVIIGIIGGIGYYLLGYSFALFLGVLTGVLQLIPIFGPWPIYVILCILDLVNGNYLRAIVVLLFGFGLSLSDMYIRPALAGKYADIHSMILLLGFMSGPLVFGLIGFILGPLILGITFAVIKAYKEEVELANDKNNDNNNNNNNNNNNKIANDKLTEDN